MRNCCTWNSYRILLCYNQFLCHRQAKHSHCTNCSCLPFHFPTHHWQPLMCCYCPTVNIHKTALTPGCGIRARVRNWTCWCICVTARDLTTVEQAASDHSSCGWYITEWQEKPRFQCQKQAGRSDKNRASTNWWRKMKDTVKMNKISLLYFCTFNYDKHVLLSLTFWKWQTRGICRKMHVQKYILFVNIHYLCKCAFQCVFQSRLVSFII